MRWRHNPIEEGTFYVEAELEHVALRVREATEERVTSVWAYLSPSGIEVDAPG
jgi:hypothetical protein